MKAACNPINMDVVKLPVANICIGELNMQESIRSVEYREPPGSLYVFGMEDQKSVAVYTPDGG